MLSVGRVGAGVGLRIPNTNWYLDMLLIQYFAKRRIASNSLHTNLRCFQLNKHVIRLFGWSHEAMEIQNRERMRAALRTCRLRSLENSWGNAVRTLAHAQRTQHHQNHHTESRRANDHAVLEQVSARRIAAASSYTRTWSSHRSTDTVLLLSLSLCPKSPVQEAPAESRSNLLDSRRAPRCKTCHQ